MSVMLIRDARGTKRHVVHQVDVVAYHRRLADHHARCVIQCDAHAESRACDDAWLMVRLRHDAREVHHEFTQRVRTRMRARWC